MDNNEYEHRMKVWSARHDAYIIVGTSHLNVIVDKYA